MHADAGKLLCDASRAVERLGRFTAGKTFTEYVADEYLQSAVERQFEIIGEAMSQFRRINPASPQRFRSFLASSRSVIF